MFLLPVSFCGKIIVRNDAMSCEKFTTTSPPTLVISQLFEFSRSCGFFSFLEEVGRNEPLKQTTIRALRSPFCRANQKSLVQVGFLSKIKETINGIGFKTTQSELETMDQQWR